MRYRFAAALLIITIITATPFVANSQVEACRLLPGSPAKVFDRSTSAINIQSGSCMGGYWPRTSNAVFGSLGEFGATIHIFLFAKVNDAKQLAARQPGEADAKDIKLGDGGLETMEDPRRPDRAVTTVEEQRSGEEDEESAVSLVEAGPYSAKFRCNAVVVLVDANPSKGPAVRKLMEELEENLRSTGRCESSSARTATNNVSPPPPSRKTSDDGTPAHTQVFEGETARQIIDWANKNARYMVVLDRRWDAQQNCWVEERAFTGGIRGSGGDRVNVSVGPSQSFCLNGKIYSAEQVNTTQSEIAKARDLLAQALETDAKYEAYLKNHPNDAIARDRYNQNKRWIEYYRKAIASYERDIANSIPSQ